MNTNPLAVRPGYESLAFVLNAALEQAQEGKGKERHASGEPFERQKICEITRRVGLGGPAFQVVKKTEEAVRLLERGNPAQAVEDLLGAINYAAAMVILVQEQSQEKLLEHDDHWGA